MFPNQTAFIERTREAVENIRRDPAMRGEVDFTAAGSELILRIASFSLPRSDLESGFAMSHAFYDSFPGNTFYKMLKRNGLECLSMHLNNTRLAQLFSDLPFTLQHSPTGFIVVTRDQATTTNLGNAAYTIEPNYVEDQVDNIQVEQFDNDIPPDNGHYDEEQPGEYIGDGERLDDDGEQLDDDVLIERFDDDDNMDDSPSSPPVEDPVPTVTRGESLLRSSIAVSVNELRQQQKPEDNVVEVKSYSAVARNSKPLAPNNIPKQRARSVTPQSAPSTSFPARAPPRPAPGTAPRAAPKAAPRSSSNRGVRTEVRTTGDRRCPSIRDAINAPDDDSSNFV
jgi:hypothetical protein